MRFKNVFSIIGPAMIGPSSSHTAGAVRIGRFARQLLGEPPEAARICFYGSFAETYAGHGTDLAVVGGILDYRTDDERIRRSLQIAEDSGIQVHFTTGTTPGVHPNTVRILLSAGERTCDVTGASIGGGTISIRQMNGFEAKCSGELPTLVIEHADRQGVLAGITALFSREDVNIGYINTDRKGRTGEALTVVEADQVIPDSLIGEISGLPHIRRVSFIHLT
ncbi:putative L-serine dehydratase, beta chain [Paenibacillus faecis]|uniref:L-serine ammonia-lyase, iron-sulfur-dependent subunit beta n=1 Tax=Paenibacillus faecis TaxID=862114 RepID=UPI001B2BDF66|nr:L-serine ammonia-lyase, iron-sulfur-dependent subunit beta [Paenibacillus faecis]GIO84355.1 putative L-serine dehydratase, beta chain [Paenibacillus faecis]